MSTRDSSREVAPLRSAREGFERVFSKPAEWLCRAPGRVNLLGGHVDYNEGLVLPVAVDLEIAVAFRGRPDSQLRLYSVEFDQTVELDIDQLEPGCIDGWSAYPAGVAWAMKQARLPLTGLDAAIAGNIPIAAGLSSSAALEVGFAAALRQAANLEVSELRLAQLGQMAENRFVGVQCGIMDQVASACARPGHAVLLDCRTLALRHVPLARALRIVILDTGISRELRSSAYNERRSECEEAVRRLAAVDDDIKSLRDVSPEHLPTLLRHLPPPIDRRARHVIGEIERVQLAAAALEHNETERFGELMYVSHRSLRDDYEVSSEQLDALVELAQRAPGVVGARLTGAGFGGCTVNLVSAALVQDFLEHVASGYEKLFGRRPDSWVTEAAEGVTVERISLH